MPAANRDKIFGNWPQNDHRSHSCSNFYSSQTFSTSSRTTPYCSQHNSPMSMPSSPLNSPPLSTSPVSPLRRTFSSTFTLIPEDREVDTIPKRTYVPKKRRQSNENPQSLKYIFVRMILFWPLFIFGVLQKFIFPVIGFIFTPLLFASPKFWMSACLWGFYKAIGLPLAIVQWILMGVNSPTDDKNHNKRTVLLSCGSTIQTLHMARNFYSAGARVVVFDFDGLFGLGRFSTAVSKYYTVPKPTVKSASEYIAALCAIVEKERPTYYVPVCATSAAHYDAMAKPHMELLGCSSFIPGTQEIAILDDFLEVMRKCKTHGFALAPHRVVSNKDELHKLYEIGWLSRYRNILMSTGPFGILERLKFILPQNRSDLKMPYEISDANQWIVIRDLPGVHYVTCTTVKESRVVANVSCLVRPESRNLVPVECEDIEKWLVEFFQKVRLHRPINGHISFRFVKCAETDTLLPLGVRVGVSLPYICHTGVHPRVLWKPCPHFKRQNSGPLVADGGRYWIHEVVLNTLKRPSVDAFSKLIGTVLDKREALFVYWDPLPYCAYYHFQLPMKSLKEFLQRRTGKCLEKSEDK